MEAQTATTRSKLVGFAFAFFCLLTTYFSGIRFYEHLLLDQVPYQGLSFALDLAGNGLLLCMSILGVVAAIVINRGRLDEVTQNWPYIAIGILIMAFSATMAAGLVGPAHGQGMTLVLPAAIVWGLIGLWAAWRVLRERGLPITARGSDVSAAKKQDAPTPIATSSRQRRSIWWKIFSVLNALLILWGIFDARNYETAFKLLGLALDVPAMIGLFLFAFSRGLLSGRFWKFFAVIYTVYWVAALLTDIPKWLADHPHGTFALASAITVSFAIQLLTVLGLWRHSSQATQPALDVPIGPPAHSGFPRVYGIADRSTFLMLAVILGTGAVWFSALVATSHLDPNKAAARSLLDPTTRASLQTADLHMTALIILLFFCTFLLVVATARRLVLQDDTISLQGPFGTRSIRKQDIRGRHRFFKMKAGVLTLVPAHAGVRPLTIRPKFETDAAFDAWLRDIPDLDAR